MERILSQRTINCGTLTLDEFIKAIRNDFIEAQELYTENYSVQHVNSYIKLHESRLDYARRHATEFAEKKWKTEKKRSEYINKAVAEAAATVNEPYYHNLYWFDVNLDPSSMGVSAFIEDKHMSDEDLECLYNKMMGSEWFKKAIGWKFVIKTSDTNTDSWTYEGRPQFSLVFDEETTKQWKEAEENLSKSVSEFYKGCRYFGD